MYSKKQNEQEHWILKPPSSCNPFLCLQGPFGRISEEFPSIALNPNNAVSKIMKLYTQQRFELAMDYKKTFKPNNFVILCTLLEHQQDTRWVKMLI